MRDKLSLDDQEVIVRARVERGDSLRVIAGRYGVSDYSIRMVLLRSGVTLGKPRLSERQRSEVRDLSRIGVSNMEISRRTGVPESSVALLLATRGQ